MTTLYMVELELADRTREVEWNAWYTAHLAKLLAISGFISAQRFAARTPDRSPFLAIYELESPAVLQSAAYTERAGPKSPGAWTAVMVNWRRNLFEGSAECPRRALGEDLAVIDVVAADPASHPPGFDWWACVGLERSVAERGIGRPGAADALDPAARPAAAVRIFRAITPRLLPR